MNRHVRSFNPDPSPPSPPQRSVQSPAIRNDRHRHHYTASSAAAVTYCFVLWWRGGVLQVGVGGEVNLPARASRKKLGAAVCNYADVWEFSSLMVGGWVGGRARDHLAQVW